MYLLDTNVVSELAKSRTGRADANVLAWSGTTSPPILYISSITIMEIEIGIRLVERRDDTQGRELRFWLERQILPGFGDRILAVDTPVARCCSGLHVPDRRPERDALIAATAIVHGLTVVTRNTKDFAGMALAVLNPWVAAPLG